MNAVLKAPFPFFGAKSRIASVVWRAFGKPRNYVEPFFGSGAVLLARPVSCFADAGYPGIETVNDCSRFLCNFWRAVKSDPASVAKWCDWPVNETDLTCRHRALVAELPRLAELLDSDPEAFDAKIAGWWVWGLCAWIGDGWCDEGGGKVPEQLPHLGNAGVGVHAKLPHLGNAGRGALRVTTDLYPYFNALSARFRRVRVACGDWSRICGDAVIDHGGLTGVFLDPPYSEGNQQYATGGTGTDLSGQVKEWALEVGARKTVRVVLCGYEGEHEMPGWRCVAWKNRGGYGNQSDGEGAANRHRERVWLSPACLDPTVQGSLFESVAT